MRGSNPPARQQFLGLIVLAALTGCSDRTSREVVIDGLDLAVTAVVAPADATEGTTVDVQVTVENVGTVEPTETTVRFDVGLAGEAGDEFDRVDLPALAPGQVHTFTHPLVLPTPMASGEYLLAAVVDAVGDGIADNDSATTTFHVVGSTCSPDVAEDNDLATSASALVVDETRHANFCDDAVDWYSFSGTAGTELGLLVEAPNAMLGFGVLAPDGTTSLLVGFEGRATFTPPTSGTYFVVVQVFPVIDENDQFHSGVGPNTDYEILLLEPTPDLVGSSLYSPGTASQGGVGFVTAYVENDGFATSQPASLVLYLSTDALITKDDLPLATGTVPALERWTSEGLDFFVVFPPELVGTYYLGAIVDPDALLVDLDHANSVTEVDTIAIVANACTPDAHEADDVIADAVPIPLETTVALDHCEDYYDWLSVSLTGGVEYTITMTPVDSWTVKPEIVVVAPDAVTQLADEPDGQLHFVAPSTGTFFLNATDKWESSSRARIGTGHGYSVRVEERLSDFAPGGSYLNPTITVAGGVIDYSVSFANAGFTTAGPHRIGVYVSTDSTVTTGDRLLVALNRTDLPLAGSGTITVPIYVPHDLATGIYYVAAIADDLDQVRERDETNNVASPVAFTVEASTCTRDAYELDDSLATAAALALGATQSKNFCDDSTDWVAITANAGDDVLIHFSASSASAAMQVFAANGTSLAGPSPLTEDDLFFEAPSSGTFYARIGARPYDYWTSGPRDYQVRAGLCPMDASEPNDGLAAAKTMTVGQVVSLNFCDDYADWFAFDAVSGVQYVLQTGSLGTNIDTRLTLRNAGGTSLASNDDINGGTSASRITWTAPASGTYYVEVTSWFDQWGFDSGFTLSLQ